MFLFGQGVEDKEIDDSLNMVVELLPCHFVEARDFFH